MKKEDIERMIVEYEKMPEGPEKEKMWNDIAILQGKWVSQSTQPWSNSPINP